MKKLIILMIAGASTAMLLSGCASKAHYVESDGAELITTVGSINIQDFAQAADDMTQSMIDNLINPGMLESAVPNKPALMAISRITNNTGTQLDTDLLVKKIRVALNRTGKVQTSTTIGLGSPEDPLAADQQKAREFFEDKKQTRMPDYTLSGKIIEVREKAGRTRQGAFVFQMSLTSTDGIAVWEEEKTIVKQGRRASVGF